MLDFNPNNMTWLRRKTLDTRIARGVRLLDDRFPDWRKTVKAKLVNVLDVRSILGQLSAGAIEDVVREVRAVYHHRTEASYGFVAKRGDEDEDIAYLNMRWKQAIETEDWRLS